MIAINLSISGGGAPTPVNTVAPAIAGTPELGETLTATPGTWTDAGVIVGQWLRDGIAISSETALTYVVGALTAGDLITYRETTIGVSATSNALTYVGSPVEGSTTSAQFAYYTAYPNEGDVYGFAGIYSASLDKTVVGQVNTPGSDVAMARTYDHATDTWAGPYQVGLSAVYNDEHGVTSFEELSDGRLVCFFGSHVDDQPWALSADGESWTQQTTLSGFYTYPKPVNIDAGGGDGSLFLLYRDWIGSSGTDPIISIQEAAYTSGGALTFGASTDLIEFASERVYVSRVLEKSGDIEFFFCRSDIDVTYRRDIFYAKYIVATGALENFDGSVSVASGSLPINRATADASFRLFASGTNEYGIVSWDRDASGNYHLAHADGDDTVDTLHDAVYRKYDGTTWTDVVLTDEIYQHLGGFYGTKPTLILDENDDPELYYPRGQVGDPTRVERGGDDMIKRTGTSFATEEVLATFDTYALYGVSVIKNADPALRTAISEYGQTRNSLPIGAKLKTYYHGSGGLADYPDTYRWFGDVMWQTQFTGMADAATDFVEESYGGILTAVGGASVLSGKLEMSTSSQLELTCDVDSFVITRRFNFGTGPWSIEFFNLEFDALSGNPTIWGNQGGGGSRGNSIYYNVSDQSIRIQSSPDGSAVEELTLDVILATGTTYHLKIERDDAGTTRLFLATGAGDAILQDSVAGPALDMVASGGAQITTLGDRTAFNGSGFDGRVEALRVARGDGLVNGTDATFTPDALPLYKP